ncbi:hypothetical protein ACP70R_033396 [Stipagrostis hirtigluma subsp. patula]
MAGGRAAGCRRGDEVSGGDGLHELLLGLEDASCT